MDYYYIFSEIKRFSHISMILYMDSWLFYSIWYQ